MSFPAFPDVCFPNAVSVRLCDDSGNVEGGFNPVPGSAHSFGASVQEKGSRDAAIGLPVNRTRYVVYFAANPDITLTRPIRSGDQVVWGNLILCATGSVLNRGGFDWLWRLECEYVNT